MNDGINIRESGQGQGQERSSRRPMDDAPQRSTRPEMRGPSDINDILSGLKTKTINILAEAAEEPKQNESSTISIADLKELQTDGALPKKSKRRQGSNKNTISLDI